MASYFDTSDPATWTNQEWVNNINRAIAYVLGGREVAINGKRLTREDLPNLREELKFREQRLSSANARAGGISSRSPVYIRF